jgi:hypothetical protein
MKKLILFIAIISLIPNVTYSYRKIKHGNTETLDYPSLPNPNNRQDVTPIAFTPINLSTEHFPELIGYFWDSTTTDETLLYGGKAKIINDQYINVIAVDAFENPSKYEEQGLLFLGIFMRQNDPIIYHVYGVYAYTVAQ